MIYALRKKLKDVTNDKINHYLCVRKDSTSKPLATVTALLEK